MVHRRGLIAFLSGFCEPVFFLFSLGMGMGALVGHITLPDGRVVEYAVFVAPAMLAVSAMNGAVAECVFNVYSKLKYMKLYDAVLNTPVTPMGIVLGEIAWALLRGGIYGAAFLALMALMGLTPSAWAFLALPGVVLIGWTFAALSMAGTTFIRSWQDYDVVATLSFLMFMFSATFTPLETYPEWVQLLIQATPLYHGVTLLRGLTTGAVSFGLLIHVAYLIAVAVVSLIVTAYRMGRALQR